MAKKSKASSVSWRTLMRRAKQADSKGHRHAAIKLRAQAADLRHKSRPKAKKVSTRRSEPVPTARRISPKGLAKALVEVNKTMYGDGAGMTADRQQQQKGLDGLAALSAPPQLAGITDSALYVEGLVQLARQKKPGGKDEIMQRLLSLQGVARYEGERGSEDRNAASLKHVVRRIDDAIVCGFLAEVDVNMKVYGGLPPAQVWNVNSLVIVKIADALNRAGYTPAGRQVGADREEKRAALMGKSHNEVHGNAQGSAPTVTNYRADARL